jgi:hypothetical protein
LGVGIRCEPRRRRRYSERARRRVDSVVFVVAAPVAGDACVCEIVMDGDGSAAASMPAAEAAVGGAAEMASVATVRERFSRRSAAQKKRADSGEGRIMVGNNNNAARKS